MTSKVLDLTTIGHAFNELCAAFLDDAKWYACNGEQQEFRMWYLDHRDEISKLDSLEALASTDFAELNKFLESRGFDPMFGPFAGIGVASILDMLVQWAQKGECSTITRFEPDNSSRDIYGRPIVTETTVDYPAFRISSEGADIYDVAGYWEPLVRLSTKTGHYLWLMKADEPKSGLELNRQAQLLARTERRLSRGWTIGAIVPMLDMNVRADLSWMIGMKIIDSTENEFSVKQAFQQFKLRADTEGAHVKVATGFAIPMAACGPTLEPYVFNEPFIGFFTQPSNETLPIAAFWADTDSWHEPK